MQNEAKRKLVSDLEPWNENFCPICNGYIPDYDPDNFENGICNCSLDDLLRHYGMME